MAVPTEIISILRGIPSTHFDKVVELVPAFKTIIPKGKSVQVYFLEAIEIGDKATIQALYNPLSLVLATGGCCGGPIGVVFNTLDAAFCAILGNWPGFVIDVLSIILVFPGAKAGLIGIGQIVKNLPRLIGKYGHSSINANVMRAVIKRIKDMGDFEEKMVKELYDMCSKFLQDKTEVYKWLWQSHQQTLNAIEAELKRLGKVTSHSANSSSSLAHRPLTAGKEITKTQEELRRGYDLSQRNIQPQTTIPRYLFIKIY